LVTTLLMLYLEMQRFFILEPIRVMSCAPRVESFMRRFQCTWSEVLKKDEGWVVLAADG
jgi:hypothetical protein